MELDKNTVNKYINQAKKDSLSVDELLALDDPVLAHRMTGGNAAYSDSRFEYLKDRLPYYASELRRPHVTMQLLWEEYSRESEHPYGITQFKEHLNRYIAGTEEKTASTILKDLYVGGEKAFLDFAGGKMQYVDVDTGELRDVEVFVATLPATDCIRGTGNLIRFKPSYDYRGWSSGRLSMIIFSRNAFHTPLQLQYYSRKIQVHPYGNDTNSHT